MSIDLELLNRVAKEHGIVFEWEETSDGGRSLFAYKSNISGALDSFESENEAYIWLKGYEAAVKEIVG